jgi:glycosyltransferase
MPPHPTFFVRKYLYEQYGNFDLRYSIAADYELMFRLIMKHQISLKYIPRVLVKMSLGGKSNRSISNIIKANMEVWQAWRNNNISFGYFVPLLKPAQKAVQFVCRR